MVRILADDACDFPETLAFELGIKFIHAKIWFGTDQYRPGVNLTSIEFYQKLESEEFMPRTIPGSPKDFYDVFVESREPTLVLLISAKLSDFYENASKAKNRFNLSHITLYDTNSVSMGSGLLVYVAGKMARLGYTVPEIVQTLNSIKGQVLVLAAANTLQYLAAGGRIPATTAAIGGLLRFKPILRIKDGESIPLGRTRGFEPAIETICENITLNIPKGSEIIACVMHSGNQDAAHTIFNFIEKHYDAKDLFETRLGSAVGAHLGPGAVGVAIIPNVEF